MAARWPLQDPEELDEQREELERRLKRFNQPILPYVIISGIVDNTTQVVVFNSEFYSDTSPLLAVEACYKCLEALSAILYLCDCIYTFIKKFVFNNEASKNYGGVSKLISEVNKSSV